MSFSDATVHNVHDIRKVQVIAGTSGTGIADFTQLYRLNFVIPPQLNATGAGVSGTYPNLTFAGPSGLNPVLYAGSFNIGNIPDGGNTFTVSFASVGTSEYYVQMTIISNSPSSPQEDDTAKQPMLRSRTASSFTFYMDEESSYNQNLILEYILFAK